MSCPELRWTCPERPWTLRRGAVPPEATGGLRGGEIRGIKHTILMGSNLGGSAETYPSPDATVPLETSRPGSSGLRGRVLRLGLYDSGRPLTEVQEPINEWGSVSFLTAFTCITSSPPAKAVHAQTRPAGRWRRCVPVISPGAAFSCDFS